MKGVDRDGLTSVLPFLNIPQYAFFSNVILVSVISIFYVVYSLTCHIWFRRKINMFLLPDFVKILNLYRIYTGAISY